MTDWIKKLLTKRVIRETATGRRLRVEEIPPSESLTILFKFSIVSIIVLSALEIAHIILLGHWNHEIFAAITGVIGSITGIIIGART